MKNKFIYLLICLVLLTGCSSKVEENNDESINNSNEIVEKKVQIIDLESDSRPIAITINNYPSAVKVQSGLADAYIIYEIQVEGGLSRSLAIYKDKYPTRVGTVRSSRHNFIDFALENDAIYAHYGWSIYAEEQEKTGIIDYLDGNSSDPSPFWRENPENLAWEHTVYGDLTKVKSLASEKGYSLTSSKKTLLNYTKDEYNLDDVTGSGSGVYARINYSNYYYVEFKYNNDDKRYYRYVNGVAHTDYYTKEHYSTKNIIIERLAVSYTANGKYLDLKDIGTGDGYYLTNGKAVPIKWTKNSRSEQTVYTYLDGTEITVNDGNTYIMIQDQSQLIALE